MRIAAIPPLYPPGSRVGAWLATHDLLCGLVERGHHVVAVPFASRPFEPFTYQGVRVCPPSWAEAAARQADVVISHLGDASRWHRLAVELGKPSVRMLHGGPFLPGALTGAALVVANSRASADRLPAFGGEVIVVNPPTFPDRYATTPGDAVTLVNLAPEKGGELFWRIARLCPHIQFLGVVGGYGSQVRLSAPNVEIIDNTSNMRDDVYARTRLLLMPSRHETWGMTAIEAACSGIPTLARPTPGLRESLGLAGNWQDGYVAGAWQQRVMSMLEPERWAEASERASARAALLDPAADIERFCDAIEGLAP